jgi:hypothetical protein
MCDECTETISYSGTNLIDNRYTRLNKEGRYHCKTHPCLIIDNGYNPYVQYRIDGVLHREAGPAVIDRGVKSWYINGIRFAATSQEEFEIEYREWKLRAFK